MAENFLTQLLPDTMESEFKYLNWIMQNTHEVYLISEKYFFNKKSKIIIKAIKNILEKNLIVTQEEILHFCQQEDIEFDNELLINIKKKSIDNIEYVKETLKENYLKYNTITQLEELVVNATSKQNISFELLEKNINDLSSSIHDVDGIKLKTAEDIVNNYKKTLEERKTKVRKRSLGYKTLNKLVTKPAYPEQMTAIVGMTGGSKTTFAKNIENKLIFQGVPVISINLENSEEDCTDLTTCIRNNIPLEEIIKEEINPRIEARIQNDLEYFKTIKNFLTYTDPQLNLNQLDGLIYKSKQIFRNNGVLKDDDEYMVIIIDLLEMLDEFSLSKNSYEIKDVLRKLFQMNRKHKTHFILLIQSNENKIRGGKIFKNSDELDYYKIGMEDIEGSAAISKRCQLVLTLTRPVQMKKRFFAEEKERWAMETDVINCNIVKQNRGNEGFTQFVLTDTFRIYPYLENKNEVEE